MVKLSEAEISLAKHFAAARRSRGFTQESLSKITGIGRSSIANFETARQRLDAGKLIQLAQCLKLSIDEAAGLKSLARPVFSRKVISSIEAAQTTIQEMIQLIEGGE